MLNSLRELEVKDIKFWPVILLTVFLLIIGVTCLYVVPGDNIAQPYQTMLVSLTVTCLVYITGALYKTLDNIRKYKKLAGNYTGYAYKSNKIGDNDFYMKKSEPQSEAVIEYLGGDNFKIQVTAEIAGSDLVWIGDLKMISSNMADIAWWYTNDDRKDSIGYKKSIFVDDDESVKLALFSVDESIHGRELFVKNRD